MGVLDMIAEFKNNGQSKKIEQYKFAPKALTGLLRVSEGDDCTCSYCTKELKMMKRHHKVPQQDTTESPRNRYAEAETVTIMTGIETVVGDHKAGNFANVKRKYRNVNEFARKKSPDDVREKSRRLMERLERAE